MKHATNVGEASGRLEQGTTPPTRTTNCQQGGIAFHVARQPESPCTHPSLEGVE